MYQYPEYNTIPQMIRDITANKVKLLDEYILFRTGEYEYSALIHDLVTGEVTRITFTKSKDSSEYAIKETKSEWDFVISNQYYCYSNVGLGAALDLPVVEGIQAHCSVVLTVVLMFLVIFRSTLFPFRKKK